MSNRMVPSSPARAPSTYRQLVARCTARCEPATRRRWRSIRCGLLRFGAQFRRWHEERGGKEEYVPFSALRQLVRPSVHQAGHKDRRGAAVRAPPGAQRPSRRCCSRSAGCPAAGAMFLSAAGRCSAPTTGRLSPSCSLAHRRTEVTVGLWVAGPPAMGQAAGQRKQER